MKNEEETTILPQIPGLKRLGDCMVKTPCFIGGEMTLDEYEDMVTHYVQSYLYRLQWSTT